MSAQTNLFLQYSGYFVGGLGFIYAIIQHIIRMKSDHAAKTREWKYQVYREYLGKLDNASNDFTKKFSEDFIKKITTETFSKIINDPDNSKDALIQMNKSIMELMSEVNVEVNKIQNELNGLRIVCSKPLLILLDEYKICMSSIMDSINKVFDSIDFTNSESIRNQLPLKIGDSALNMKDLFLKIEKQMRIDLGVDK
jgi:hypothetical protein